MRNVWLIALLVAIATIVGLGGYYMGGRSDALDDVRPLTRLADKLLRQGEGGPGLGTERVAALLKVERAMHPGDRAGAFTQELALRLGFEHFEPGIAQIRLVGYRDALADRLSKRRILAIWLETVEMGQGPDGPITGFFDASEAIYDRLPAELNDDEFLRLLAAATGPRRYSLIGVDPGLQAREAQIRALLSGASKSLPVTAAEPQPAERVKTS